MVISGFLAPAESRVDKDTAASPVIPTPCTDMALYLESLDLRDMFNFMSSCRPALFPKPAQILFRGSPSDGVETFRDGLQGFPLNPPAFFAAHSAAYENHVRDIRLRREQARRTGAAFEEPPPPFPTDYCPTLLAKHLHRVAQELLVQGSQEGHAKRDWDAVALTLCAPGYKPSPNQLTTTIHTDENGYGLVLALIPAMVPEPA